MKNILHTQASLRSSTPPTLVEHLLWASQCRDKWVHKRCTTWNIHVKWHADWDSDCNTAAPPFRTAVWDFHLYSANISQICRMSSVFLSHLRLRTQLNHLWLARDWTLLPEPATKRQSASMFCWHMNAEVSHVSCCLDVNILYIWERQSSSV